MADTRPHLLIWGGPVARNNMDADLPGPLEALTINQGVGGIGSNAFRDLALSKVHDGHILPSLLADKGWDIDQFRDISLAGFSAFHGMAAEILKRDAAWVSACVCLDACFSSFASVTKEGYVTFGEMAAEGLRLFVMTGSLGGGDTFTTGVQCVIENGQAAAAAAGVSLQDVHVPEGVPAPSQALGVQGLVVLDYQGLFTHGQHVTKLGKPVLEAYLAPWLSERRIPYPPARKSSSGFLAGLFGLGVVAAGTAIAVSAVNKKGE